MHAAEEKTAQGEKEAIEALEQLKQDPAWAQVEEALKDEL